MRTGGIILFPGCTNKCVFCEIDGIPKAGKLGLLVQEARARLNLRTFREEGIEFVEISGGDPLEYPGLIALIKKIHTQGKRVQLSTHGKQLSDINVLQELKDAGLTKLRIPLYAADTRHDLVTQTPGSFTSTLQGIQNAIQLGIPLQISTLILQENKEALIGLLDLVKSLGITDFYVSTACLANGLDYYYVPFKDMPLIVHSIEEHARTIGLPIIFREIPYCVFKHTGDNIHCKDRPPEHSYIQKEVRSDTKDWPSYRLKMKPAMCTSCAMNDSCDGFFKKDIERYGTGDLRPIEQSNDQDD